MPFQILTVVGTRPNFIKVTQFKKHLDRPDRGHVHKLLHTGQHYDDKMSRIFFEQFQLEPDYWLNVPAGSPNSQIAQIMLGLEKVILEEYRPDLLLVVGDVNSTLAASLTAQKMGIPFAHIESGLRSLDRGMPEEINRILTDEIADFCFITEQSGIDNLLAEKKSPEKLAFVGNTMIDTLVAFDKEIQASTILEDLELQKGTYILTTMHRPATVDVKEGLTQLLDIFEVISVRHPLVFPIHPRTRNNISKFGLDSRLNTFGNVKLVEPLGYFGFQKLIADCKYVFTDSGGIQEETTFRQVPCLTLRPNTERPATIEVGSNVLVPFETAVIADHAAEIEKGTFKKGEVPTLWDGNATQRIAEFIQNFIM